jgi:hypothetical protein
MATLDDYYAAKDQVQAARRGLNAIADELVALAAKLRDSRGVRLNEPTTYIGSAPPHQIVDKDDLVRWDRLEPVVRAFTEADSRLRRIEGELTAEQRRNIQGR